MKRYTVRLNSEAEEDIFDSYEWGVRNWGPDAAEKWIRKLYEIIFDRLSLFPNGCPLAPDVNFENREIRQLIVGRYRVLFEVRKLEVAIIHVRGPFTDASLIHRSSDDDCR